jgi:hypothetical protein
MFSKPHRVVVVCLDARHRAVAALSAALIASLAALLAACTLASAGPTDLSSAGAVTRTQGRPAAAVRPLLTSGELLPSGELEELLARLPLNDLSAAQLAHSIAGLQGVSALSGLQGLLGEELGATGLEHGLAEAIEQLKLANSSATLGELTNAQELLPSLESRLGGLLKLLGPLLDTEQREALKGAVSSLDLDQLVGSLLSSASPGEQLATELSGLADGIFGELGTEGKLGGLLGFKLTGGFSSMTVGEVAEELKTTPEAVSEELGQTPAQLPATTTMLTAPLTKGKLVGVAPAGLKGLALGLLGEGSEGSGESDKGSGEGSEDSGESGEGSGEGNGSGQGGGGAGGGSQGGSGEGGHGGSTGTTTIAVTLPGSSSAAASAVAKQQLGKIRVLSHRVRGRVATIVLNVPAAGRVTLAGQGVRAAAGRATKAERLTLRVRLTRAGVASLRRSRRPLRVKLTASFKPTAAGTGSTTSVTVSFE